MTTTVSEVLARLERLTTAPPGGWHQIPAVMQLQAANKLVRDLRAALTKGDPQ